MHETMCTMLQLALCACVRAFRSCALCRVISFIAGAVIQADREDQLKLYVKVSPFNL